MLHFQAWKITFILGAVAIGLLFGLPNVLPEDVRAKIPGFLPSDTVNLGLDLQGGTHLLFEAGMERVYQQRLDSIEGSLRDGLRSERIGYTALRVVGQIVRVTIRDAENVEKAVSLARDLAEPVGGGTMGLGGQPNIVVATEEGNRISIQLTDEAIINLRNSTITQTIEVVRRRIDELGTREPTIQRQGVDRILVQVPGADPEDIITTVTPTAFLSFHKVDTSVSLAEALGGRVPPQSELLEYLNPEEANGQTHELIERRAILTGDDLSTARTTSDEYGLPAVSFTLNPRGAKIFADYSSNNIGQRFAIVLDGKVISAPVIRSAIVGGSGQISGGYTDFAEADKLSILLRAGSLPATLEVREQRSVGPDLGADSIAAGETAALVGIAAILVFMILSYGLFGVFANIALIINLGLVMGILTMLGATLTLPGIAGIALTLGMAVDANVLIFERIREEIRLGKSPINAMDTGYQKAMSTIFDANITTFIAAAIMFIVGSGPVKGFAVTLAIGIITSVFTAVSLTRLIVATWYRTARPNKLPI